MDDETIRRGYETFSAGIWTFPFALIRLVGRAHSAAACRFPLFSGALSITATT